MFKKILFIFFIIPFAVNTYALTFTASSNGAWNASSTWTISGTMAGTITTSNASTSVTGIGTTFNDLAVGDQLYTSGNVYIGTISAIGNNTSMTLSTNAASTNAGITYTILTTLCSGTITSNNASTAIIGTGTNFTTQLVVGSILTTNSGTIIGTVASITDATHLTLVSNAASTNAGIAYSVYKTPFTNTDDIISSGISVTSASTIQTYKTLTVDGTLTITGNLGVINNHSVTIDNGGTITTSGNLSFSTNTATPNLTVSTGGTFNLGGNIIGDNTTPITFNNSGYVEINGNVGADQLDLTNNTSGVILIHGNIAAANSNIKIFNYGIVTVDQSMSITKTNFFNYSTGKFFDFGDITVDNSSTFNNYGLLQANNFNIGDATFVNATCTSSLTGTISSTSTSTSITGTGTLFTTELSVGNVITNSTTCVAIGKVSSITDDTHLILYANAFSTYSGSYATSLSGTVIALTAFNATSTTCPGCSMQTIGTVYDGTLTFPSTPYCNGVLCSTWFPGTGGTQTITPGRRIWLAADNIGYGLGNDGDNIKRWFDLANTFGFYMSQATVGLQPTLKNSLSGNLNFNPLVNFTGAGKRLDLTSHYLEATSGNNGMAMFAVVVPASGSTGTPAVLDFGLQATKGYGLGYSSSDAMVYTATTPGGIQNTISGHGRSTRPTLLSSTTAWPGNQSFYLDGTSVAGPTAVTLTQLTSAEINEAATATATNGPFTLGCASTTSTSFDYEGYIGEIIVYANKISSTIQQAVESYLALKYGITLSHNYLDYTGAKTVFAIDGTYITDIAGLAREDLNFLNQKKSKSSNTNAELTISTASIDNSQYNQKNIATTISNNVSYLVWGHNGQPVAGGNRIYKVTATNFKQKVYLQFAISGLTSTPILLVADNATFTTNIKGVTGIYDGTYLTYNTTFSNNKDQYFKLLIPTSTSTPGVTISSGTLTPQINTAELEVRLNPATPRGILLPSMTTLQMNAIGTPATGLLIYNTDLTRYMYYNGTSWGYVGKLINYTSAQLGTTYGTFNGQLIYNTTTNTIWYWNGTSWKQLN
jgi:hypothetical protein